MSFSVYDTQNACLPIPNSYFSKCVLNSFFKETQAVELVSTCFSVHFCFVISYVSLVKEQGYQSQSFNIYASAVSFRKLTTEVSAQVQWGLFYYLLGSERDNTSAVLTLFQLILRRSFGD